MKMFQQISLDCKQVSFPSSIPTRYLDSFLLARVRDRHILWIGLFCQRESLAEKSLLAALEIQISCLLLETVFAYLFFRGFNVRKDFPFPVLLASVWLQYPAGDQRRVPESLCHSQMGEDLEETTRNQGIRCLVNVPLIFYPLLTFPWA